MTEFMASILTFIVFAPIVILLCILFRKIYDKTIEFFRNDSANPMYKEMAGLILWFTMCSTVFWIIRKEMNISDETCVALLSIWFLTLVAGAVLTQVLPDGRFKQIFGYVLFAVAFLPALALCCRILGKDFRAWSRHIVRGAGVAMACSQKTQHKNPSKRKPTVNKENS